MNGGKYLSCMLVFGLLLTVPLVAAQPVKPAPANAGEMRFHVAETSSGQPLVGASVVSLSQPQGQTPLVGWTNSTGDIIFSLILPGDYQLYFSQRGYYNFTYSVTISPYQVLIMTITLAIMPQQSGGGGTGSGNGSEVSIGVLALPVISTSVIVLLIFVGVAVLRRRSSMEHSGAKSAFSRDEIAGKYASSEEKVEPVAGISFHTTCSSCGAILQDKTEQYCWSCGANLKAMPQPEPANIKKTGGRIQSGSCMICQLKFREGDNTVSCPYCGNLAHKTHMLEWLHVKNYCPVCHRRLNEEEFRNRVP